MAAPIYQVSPLMGSNIIIVVFAVVVIGGMGSILGAIVSGFALGLIEGLTKVFYPEASNTVIFVIMAIVLLVKPAGLFGQARAEMKRRLRSTGEAATARRCVVAAGDSRRARWSRAVLPLSGLPDEGAVHGAVRLRLQPADRLCRAAVVRPRRVFRQAPLHHRAYASRSGACRRSWRSSPASRSRRLLGAVFGWLAIRRAGHLFRDDHAGPRADGLFLLRCRRRSPAARTASRRCRAAICSAFIDLNDTLTMYYFVLAMFLIGFALIIRTIHSPFGQVHEGDPRERAARRSRSATAPIITSCWPSCCRRRWPGSPAATKALVFQFASLTDVYWTMSGEVVLMTLLGGIGTILGPVVGAFIW